ncbi:MAG TPA: hypothetical protein VI895_08195 [Bdellovibrionota bacterium]|nr:hypothetical protein [Bdellovibrionota bacterium]
MILGTDENGAPVHFTEKDRRMSHSQVLGGGRKGKSSFLQVPIREDILDGKGLTLIDRHGSLYWDVVRWLAYVQPKREIILLNFSSPKYITGFNPFVSDRGDVSTRAYRMIDATVRPFGEVNTNELPTMERILRILYSFAAEAREPLLNASLLLRFPQKELREYAFRIIQEPNTRQELAELMEIKTLRDWMMQTLSATNRIGRFLAFPGVRRFMGMKENNIDISDAMDRKAVILVNLAPNRYDLSDTASKLIACLMVYEHFTAAFDRWEGSPLHTLYMDEFQDYITDDLARMLDQVLKFGLHAVLVHHHLAQFGDDEHLRESIITNARNRFVFGGLPYDTTIRLANEMALDRINTRQIKKQYFHTIHLYREETRTVRSSGIGNSSGHSDALGMGLMGPAGENNPSRQTQSSSSSASSGSSYFEGESTVPFLNPIPTQELGSESEYTREEKVSIIAHLFNSQPQRHCFVKLDNQPMCSMKVRDLYHPFVSVETLQGYVARLYREQGAIPGEEVDRRIEESQIQLLKRVESSAGLSPEDYFPMEEKAPAAPPKRRRSKK